MTMMAGQKHLSSGYGGGHWGEKPALRPAPGIKSVVHATVTVDVTMGDFVFGGVTYRSHLDFEGQALTCQRVVAIDSDLITVKGSDGDDLHAAIRSGGMELHAHFQLVNAFEHVATQYGHQIRGEFAVGVFRLDGHLQFIADLLAIQLTLQPGNDVACAVQVY